MSTSADVVKLSYPWKAALFAALMVCVTQGTSYIFRASPFSVVLPLEKGVDAGGNLPLPGLPIVVDYRPSVIVPGMVIRVTNRSDRTLSLLLSLGDARMEGAPSHSLLLEPGSTRAVGGGEALPLKLGDKVRITEAGFQPWEGQIPQR